MMVHWFIEKGPWFRAKRYGYGAGLPTKWQGWVVLALYLLAMAGIGLLSDASQAQGRIAAFIMFIIFTGIFIAICRHRTEGGWKWRWGRKA